ncbi:MAG: hypothetical protein KAS04_04080 [Candidatus Aenigmarchaeota archaeon]|nr:hypothetical protein [Candidatus Aenigmarchaeota archaeon]
MFFKIKTGSVFTNYIKLEQVSDVLIYEGPHEGLHFIKVSMKNGDRIESIGLEEESAKEFVEKLCTYLLEIK